MVITSLDTICKNVLLQQQLPMHYYIECLTHAANCLAELTKDDLKIIKTERLTLNDLANHCLPEGYLDFTKVGIEIGQMVRPLVPENSINRLPNYDDSGTAIAYTDTITSYVPALIWSTTIYNDYGEYIGREYGSGAGFQTDTFKIIPERNIIQCKETLKNCDIIMEYISDGSCVDDATGVDPYAKESIDAYIKWKRSKSRDNIYSPEGQEYARQRKILRARKAMGYEELKRIYQDALYASPKA
jgi:hypothetical protein